MKKKYIYILLLTIIVFTACNEEVLDTTAPGKVTDISYKPTNGGAILTFTAPDDNDLLYVKAVYTNSLGKEVFKVTSHYGDSIEIDGFKDAAPQKVKLYAVDRSNNVSEATEIEVTPLKSFIYLVQESIQLKEQLGGVRITWQNPDQKTVFVYVSFTKNGKTYERILSSALSAPVLMIRGLEPEEYNFSVTVEDFNGNKTDKVIVGSYKPLLEQKIDKSTWKVLQNLSVDGDKWEGTLASFWDDVVDTKESAADNSYFIINRDDNGGMLKWPLDIVVDLNKTVVINRFVVWQRAFAYVNAEQNGVSTDYYYYKEENMKSFSVSVSNDKLTWTSLGTFDIGDPRDAAGVISPAKYKEAIDGHEFNLESVSQPFRYLKFSVLSNYGSETNVYGSEITLYGLDNQQ
ncbi:MAG TPA: DUF4959 domain-containing protein [Paludibacteraceae bacterium]|nr:DUF4959 domain-containing protein [Paludibacteraceae bacterium]